MKQDKEVWLRGEIVKDIQPLLQPVAHALLQAREEIEVIMHEFPATLIWERPAQCAAPAFHLKHIAGVLDRLLSYAERKMLTEQQLSYLNKESQIENVSTEELVTNCITGIDKAIERLKQFSTDMLTEKRGVGRAQLPSTVIGLCTHAAEHTMRHVGQLLVTVKVLTG